MPGWRSTLRLKEHPEGGVYREIHRSDERVLPFDGRTERRAISHIYFSLSAGEISRFHRVESDEIWHLYEGKKLLLHEWEEGSDQIRTSCLGGPDYPHCYVVRKGFWQAAELIGEAVLVGCTVGPGFEFEDFRLLDSCDECRKAIQAIGGFERFL
ncbi:MAG: cupin domain-containing protein [Verrucomicrobiota bacterium]